MRWLRRRRGCDWPGAHVIAQLEAECEIAPSPSVTAHIDSCRAMSPQRARPVVSSAAALGAIQVSRTDYREFQEAIDDARTLKELIDQVASTDSPAVEQELREQLRVKIAHVEALQARFTVAVSR